MTEDDPIVTDIKLNSETSDCSSTSSFQFGPPFSFSKEFGYYLDKDMKYRFICGDREIQLSGDELFDVIARIVSQVKSDNKDEL